MLIIARSRPVISGGVQMYNDALEAFGGAQNLNGIRGYWKGGGDIATNFDSFMDNLRAGMTPGDAAMNTFSGEVARRNGFVNPTIVNVSPGLVEVIFTR